MQNKSLLAAVAASFAMASFGTDESLRYCITFDDANNPLAAETGEAATVVNYSHASVSEVSGLGNCSLVTDAAIKEGLAAGSEALTIPLGQALRIPHGVGHEASAPWCISMRVYVPKITSGTVYMSLFDVAQDGVNDASICIKKFGENDYSIGGGSGNADASWGYSGITPNAWHVITCSMDVDRTRLFVDGKLLSDRKFALDKFQTGRLTLRDRQYVFVSGDNDGEDNTLHFDWVKVYSTAEPAEIFGNGVSYLTFDGENPLAATVGVDGKIVNYSNAGVSEVSGLGSCSIATDAEVTAGLEAGSKALTIVKGQALRIAHGVNTSAKRPWGISMRVYVPENVDAKSYNSLFATHQQAKEDAAICIKRSHFTDDGSYGIGNGTLWGYFRITHKAWHVVTILTDEEKSSMFLDGVLLATKFHSANEHYKRYNLKDRPYLFLSGDDDGEDAVLHFDWVKIFDHAEPEDELIAKCATWTEGGWVIKDKATGTVIDSSLDAATEIRLTGETAMSAPKETPLTCARLVVDGSVTLAADCDWRGLGLTPWRILPGAKLDLNGHRLDVATMRAAGAVLPTLANLDALTDADAEFHIDVGTYPERNDRFVFSGGVKFVKDGAGWFSAYVENQRNSGGVEVAGGVFECGFNPAYGSLGAESSNVRVGSGAVFDMAGRTGLERHVLCLDGGMITSLQNKLVAPPSETSLNPNQNWTMGELRMTADSSIEFADLTLNHDVRVQDGSTWDLGGHVLDIVFRGYDPDFYTMIPDSKAALVIQNGLVRATGNGYFHDNGIDGTQGGSLSLDCILRLQILTALPYSRVCDFTLGRSYMTSNLQSNGKLKVYGTFLPDSDYCFQVELQDGSAIDVSSFSEAWPLAFKPTQASTVYTTGFADGATVTIKLGARTFESATQVISWAKAPDGVTFVFDAETHEKYSLRSRADGLYAVPRRGLIVVAH